MPWNLDYIVNFVCSAKRQWNAVADGRTTRFLVGDWHATMHVLLEASSEHTVMQCKWNIWHFALWPLCPCDDANDYRDPSSRTPTTHTFIHIQTASKRESERVRRARISGAVIDNGINAYLLCELTLIYGPISCLFLFSFASFDGHTRMRDVE